MNTVKSLNLRYKSGRKDKKKGLKGCAYIRGAVNKKFCKARL